MEDVYVYKSSFCLSALSLLWLPVLPKRNGTVNLKQALLHCVVYRDIAAMRHFEFMYDMVCL